jgi:hypothetical protein
MFRTKLALKLRSSNGLAASKMIFKPLSLFGTCLFFGASQVCAAEDVLECRTRVGDCFVLRSAYQQRLLPALTPHNSPIYDRQPWRAEVVDKKGRARRSGLEPVQIRYAGNQRWALDLACAEFSNPVGTPLAQERFRTALALWAGPGELPAAPPGVGGNLEPSPELQQQGFISRGPARLSPLQPADVAHLVYEVALFRSKEYGAGVAAVWQSQSDDGGRNWSAPLAAQQSRLFELGRPIADSCFVARATHFNGKALATVWPGSCAPASAQAGR